jgi:GT2 family glycosyltransferase
MTPLVSVVLVAYASADDLGELLPLLQDPRLEVIVVDNASPDRGVDVVARHPWCRSIEMGWNAGWTLACNVGARAASCEVIAFVNPDVRVRPAQLLQLAEHLGHGVASVSPRFVGLDGEPQPFAFRFPTPLMGLMVFFNAGRRIDRWLGSRYVRRRTYEHGRALPTNVDHIGAACLVVDAAVFTESGGFDERMWLFFSDTDWALRIGRTGRLNASVSDVVVVHEGGGSVGHLPPRALETTFQRDYLMYATKHFSPLGRAVTRMGVLVLVGLLPGLAALVRRDGASARACMSQVREVMR